MNDRWQSFDQWWLLVLAQCSGTLGVPVKMSGKILAAFSAVLRYYALTLRGESSWPSARWSRPARRRLCRGWPRSTCSATGAQWSSRWVCSTRCGRTLSGTVRPDFRQRRTLRWEERRWGFWREWRAWLRGSEQPRLGTRYKVSGHSSNQTNIGAGRLPLLDALLDGVELLLCKVVPVSEVLHLFAVLVDSCERDDHH